ncbi:hypothetical protein BAC1_00195 [uncultured bacterium]|nr:hypothetical protein BAC1_00195 [uncultured bacterium]
MEERIEIPFHLLTADALKGLIEEFVSREGTDYGQGEYTFEGKAASVKKQLESGRAVILYDPVTEGCNIVLREELRSV